MKCVLFLRDCKYAQDKPSLPTLEFAKDKTAPLADYLADSIIANKDGVDITAKEEARTANADGVEPETKENPKKSRKAPKGK